MCFNRLLRYRVALPGAAVEGAVLDRLGQMVGQDRLAAFEVGDGAGDLTGLHHARIRSEILEKLDMTAHLLGVQYLIDQHRPANDVLNRCLLRRVDDPGVIHAGSV